MVREKPGARGVIGVARKMEVHGGMISTRKGKEGRRTITVTAMKTATATVAEIEIVAGKTDPGVAVAAVTRRRKRLRKSVTQMRQGRIGAKK
jgi:hypothetical protein